MQMFLEMLNGLIQQQYYNTSRSILSTHNARYFPSKLTENVEIGFPRSLLYPILFQSLTFQTTVTTLEPAPVMNTDLVKISLPSIPHMYNSQDQLKAHLLQQCKIGTVSCHPQKSSNTQSSHPVGIQRKKQGKEVNFNHLNK